MAASMADDLGPKSTLCSQDSLLVMVFWTYFPSTIVLTCNTGLLAFQRQLLLEYGCGPEKDRNVCVFGGGVLCSLSADSSGQLNVLWHYGNSPGMDGTQVGILEQTDKIGLHCFLETQYGH